MYPTRNEHVFWMSERLDANERPDARVPASYQFDNEGMFIAEVGDGNCFYRSISRHLFGDPRYHHFVRNAAVGYLAADPAYIEEVVNGDEGWHTVESSATSQPARILG